MQGALGAARQCVIATIMGVVVALTSGHVVQAQSVPATVDSARAAHARGDTERAIALYRDVVRADSSSREALRELAQLYGTQGKWQDALPLARRRAALGESDFALERDLGQWLVWSGSNDEGLVHLRKAIALAPDSASVRLALGQTLTWNPRTRDEGLAVLYTLERERPSDRAVRRAIASPLTWNPVTRREGVRRLATLVREDSSASLLTEYANVLSFASETRSEALRQYERLSRLSPGSLDAARGRVKVLTWSRRPNDGLHAVDSALLRFPTDTMLLESRATLLSDVGRHAEAIEVLRGLVERAPANVGLQERLGYALLAAGDRAEARRVASRLPSTDTPTAPDWIRRGAAPALGVDVAYQSNSFGLQLARMLVDVSTAVAVGTRLSVIAGRTRYVVPSDTFNSNNVSVVLERRAARLLLLRAQAGAEQYEDTPSSWSSAGEAEVAVGADGSIRAFGQRAPVEDSRRSASGVTIGGRVIGQVRANTAGLAVRLPTFGTGFRLTASAGLGLYTGFELRDNMRRDFTVSALRSVAVGDGGTRVEFGVGYSFLDFEFDANRSDSSVPANEIGNYWSPSNFGNASGSIGLSVPITGRLTWRADGSIGRLVSGATTTRGRTSILGTTELRLVGRSGWDLTAGTFYIDNLSGFILRQSRAGVRHSF